MAVLLDGEDIIQLKVNFARIVNILILELSVEATMWFSKGGYLI